MRFGRIRHKKKKKDIRKRALVFWVKEYDLLLIL